MIELSSPNNFGDKVNPSMYYVLGWMGGPIFWKIMQGRFAKGSCLLQQVYNENMKYGDIAYIQKNTLTMKENHGKTLLTPYNIRSSNLGHKFKDQRKFQKKKTWTFSTLDDTYKI